MECYEVTRKFPKQEVYGLSSQLQRAAVSVPANIAEGASRHHIKEYLNHLSIAYGSLAELETDLLIAQRLGYVGQDRLENLFEKSSQVGRMLNGLKRKLTPNNPRL